MIVDKEYIPDCGPLYVFGNDSFIYVSIDGGCLCEIAIINGKYTVSFKVKESNNDFNGNFVSVVNNGKYLISSNKYKGCSVFNYSY